VTNQADSKLAGRDSFSDLGAATVHEAASGIGALPSSIKPLSGEFRLFGAAFTVKFPPADNLWLHRAIYAAPTGSGSGYPQASDGLEAQTRGMFADVGRVVEARGVKVEHIVKMAIWVCDRAARKVIDTHRLELFPDPVPPASHTLAYQLPDPMPIQAEFFGGGVTEWQPRIATEISMIY
jgi:enamine deaminase RidA (YjgF/YER057c/UK114 family)